MGGITSAIGNVVGDLVGGLTGASQQAEAAQQAAGIQAGMSQQSIEEQRRQFDKLIELMSPYVQTGQQALTAQQGLLGLGGAGVQQQAIEELKNSPYFQAMMQQGQNAMLQNASATGGLRGGNVQAAMAQLAPNILAQTYQQQLANLGGLSQLGQASAAGQASQGMNMASNIGKLLGQQGSALAGGQMAAGSVPASAFGTLLQGAGLFAAAGGVPGIKKLF